MVAFAALAHGDAGGVATAVIGAIGTVVEVAAPNMPLFALVTGTDTAATDKGKGAGGDVTLYFFVNEANKASSRPLYLTNVASTESTLAGLCV